MIAITVYAANDGQLFSSQEDADLYEKTGWTYKTMEEARSYGKVFPTKIKTGGKLRLYLATDGCLFETRQEAEEYEKGGCNPFRAWFSRLVGQFNGYDYTPEIIKTQYRELLEDE